MIIRGFQTLTLLDYPGKLAATVFTGNCNFRCRYCHNSGLVCEPEKEQEIGEDQVFGFLEKRKGILEGVCITGGEPTLQEGLADFIRHVRELGYAVKLDTNGYRPEVLYGLIEDGLLDYVAMDIKTDKERYAEICGVEGLDLSRIEESVRLIRESGMDYEFRTTVVREYYDEEAARRIGSWLEGSRRYALQAFRDSEAVMCPGLHARSPEEMEHYAQILKGMIQEVLIRGE